MGPTVVESRLVAMVTVCDKNRHVGQRSARGSNRLDIVNRPQPVNHTIVIDDLVGRRAAASGIQWTLHARGVGRVQTKDR